MLLGTKNEENKWKIRVKRMRKLETIQILEEREME